MDSTTPPPDLIRQATTADIETLVAHHVAMFKEIMSQENKHFDDDAYRRMAAAHTRKLNEDMPLRLCVAWVIVDPSVNPLPLASAAITIQNSVPTPFDELCKVGLLHSVYTEIEWRKRGFAGLLVRTILDYAQSIGLNRVDLAASVAGRRLYEKIGFENLNSVMRIYLRENG